MIDAREEARARAARERQQGVLAMIGEISIVVVDGGPVQVGDGSDVLRAFKAPFDLEAADAERCHLRDQGRRLEVLR